VVVGLHEACDVEKSRHRGLHRASAADRFMRWFAVACMLVLTTFSPVMVAAAAPVATESMEAVVEANVVVHRAESIEAYITVHNTADVDQSIEVALASNHTGLTFTGLPTEHELAANHLRQITFTINASSDAPFTTHDLLLQLTGTVDPSTPLEVVMQVKVAPYSNLSFGAEGTSQFTVDERVRTTVAVNMTNGADILDNVTFSLYSASGWNWGWNMDVNAQGHAYLNLSSGELGYIYLWVDVPAVVDGAPLEGTGPRWTVSAVSGIDNEAHIWNFDLLMNQKRNMSIDGVEEQLSLAPGEDGRASVTVRNTGNTPGTVNLTLLAVDANGQPISGMSSADRFNRSGWTVALFGGLEHVVLAPNESRTVEVGIQAPNELSGDFHVQFIGFSSGAPSLARTAMISATINRVSNASLLTDAMGCTALNAQSMCNVTTSVTNTGNAYDTLTLRVLGVTDGFNITVNGTDQAFFLPGQTKSLGTLHVEARSDLLAFTEGTLSLEVINDQGHTVSQTNVSLRIAPLIRWNLTVVEERVDARGQLSIALEVRNDGNAADGLLVQLQSSHLIEMGLIPPADAVWEEGVANPRSIELDAIPLGSTFTLRAWADLPQDQPTNGTVYLNTTLRSRYTPEDAFVHTSTGDYLGTPWQSSDESEEGFNVGQAFALSVAYLKAWSGVLLALAFSVGMVAAAVRARKRRNEEQSTLPYQKVNESADDWMAKFNAAPASEAPPSAPMPEAQPMAAEAFEQAFRRQHGHTAPSQAPVNTALVSAAQLVLEKRTDERELKRADDLLSSLNRGETASPMMDLPPPTPASPSSPAPAPSTPPSATVTTASHPTPVVDDDLDF